jgi:cytochrome c
MKMLCLVSAFALISATGAAQADGDPAKGAIVFKKCMSCHTVKEGVNRVGPSLHAIVDRSIATDSKFRYSDGMKAFGEGGHKWDEATLTTYLKAPRDIVPGTKMAFPGLKKPEDIADVIAYLKNPDAAE